MRIFARKGKTKAKTKRGQRRRRVTPLWRSRAVIVTAAVMAIASAGAGGWWLWHDGWVARAAAAARDRLVAASVRLNFTVQEVMVVGRQETARKDLLGALGVARGAPILALDLEAARRRVERLPWVHAARIERLLPDTLVLSVTERRPLALWQNHSRFSLIDRNGAVIPDHHVERFAGLPVVVGKDAPAHAAELLATLATQPSLVPRVKAAVWVGGRRWNVVLDNGIDVRLPEDDPAAAWARLAEFQRRHQILARDIRILDLRLPDRLIIRRPPRGDPARSAPGRET